MMRVELSWQWRERVFLGVLSEVATWAAMMVQSRLKKVYLLLGKPAKARI